MESDRLPLPLRAQLDHLLTHSAPSIKVHQLWSGSSMHGLFDRFTLLIPYCLQQLRWDVIYNAQSPLAAPDIIFPAEDEPFNSFILRRDCSTVHQKDILRDWVGSDPSSLLVLINELREQYSAYQRSRTQEVDDDRLAFEISTMLSREGIELYVKSNDTKVEEVRFAVPLLAMNINNMVVGCIWKCAQKIYLGVVFPCAGRKPSSSSSSPPQIKLVATSGLRDLLSVDDVNLPAWSHGMCMAEYIPDLEENLEREILRAVSAIDQRRRFIEVLAAVFGWPIQTDSVFCRKAVFHLANGTFTFLVYFELPPQFPIHSPIAILQSSMQCMNSDGSPIRSTELSGCPWSPRWDVYEMTDRMRDYLADEALNFKKHCMQTTAMTSLVRRVPTPPLPV